MKKCEDCVWFVGCTMTKTGPCESHTTEQEFDTEWKKEYDKPCACHPGQGCWNCGHCEPIE